FLYACQFGRNDVVEFFIGRGIDLGAQDAQGQTGLHWAVIGGHLDTVKLVLSYQPPLEAKNKYGGTVVGQALWSAAHDGDTDVYIGILEALVAAGAKVPETHAPINPRIDEWLEGHGSRTDTVTR
ncbi:MAG TPA: ankyrin repeat domain-containing protein, partial [Terriglobales bacterium]|nr:ankyrin repeat domain-containing protein [Terriglobales bacterium]